MATVSPQPPPLPGEPIEEVAPGSRPRPLLRNLAFLGLCALVGLGVAGALWRQDRVGDVPQGAAEGTPAEIAETVTRVDAAFRQQWEEAQLATAPRADQLTVARRLSLALTGTIPSLEELRVLEALPEDQRLNWWLDRLLADERFGAYFAERFARAYVGVENGPFLVYRRRRLTTWLGDQFLANRPYDALVREIISAEGIWTSNPAANFLTATIDQDNEGEGPDEVKLAARLTRAFLGVRIDCVQCHDDAFGDRWKQEDFHQLAAFFAQAKMSIGGVQDDPKLQYETRYLGKKEEEPVEAAVPFSPELLPRSGSPRERLAIWTTHPANEAFARATVNRVWALLFNRPLIEPIDDIPLEGPYPPGLEILAEDLAAHQYDLQRLIRIIASSEVFQLASRSEDPNRPIDAQSEAEWAVFPLTRLRPEQVAGSILQSASLSAIDNDSHILRKLVAFGEGNDFVQRYGDAGEDEFGEQSGTIPQRLLMMNGNVVTERTSNNPVMNAATRIGILAPDDRTAVEAAYLSVLSRRPTAPELAHFSPLLEGIKGNARALAMQDLYWALLNATEFSWNH